MDSVYELNECWCEFTEDDDWENAIIPDLISERERKQIEERKRVEDADAGLLKELFSDVKKIEHNVADFNSILDQTGIPTWGNCRIFDAGGEILKCSDLDDFEDTRVRMLAYYAAIWYSDVKADNIDRCYLYDIYAWLVEQKPSTEMVSKDARCRLIIYYINTFGAQEGDAMGAADLTDVKWELKQLHCDGELTEQMTRHDILCSLTGDIVSVRQKIAPCLNNNIYDSPVILEKTKKPKCLENRREKLIENQKEKSELIKKVKIKKRRMYEVYGDTELDEYDELYGSIQDKY